MSVATTPSAAGALAAVLGNAGTLSAPTPVSTGYAALDAVVGGWPGGGLVELLVTEPGHGELRLCVPFLRAVCRRGLRVAWLNPPLVPYAPALAAAGLAAERQLWLRVADRADAAWAAATLLDSRCIGAALIWPDRWRYAALRRLQLSGRQQRIVGFVIRPPQALAEPSPARLRLNVRPLPHGHAVDIAKRDGGASRTPSVLLPHAPAAAMA